MYQLNKYTKYVKPILALEKYVNHHELNEKISSLFADYMFANSDFVYEHIIDYKPVGIIAG